MRMDTGEIVTQEQAKKLEELYGEKKATPLTEEEYAALEPKNRHERRALLVQMRRKARALAAQKSEEK